ncbi:MAG: tetratricopeptide repeat protein [Candidatus Omnitrophica bacterium]|nr:tetratricopeptide repeat protein [Candidatus Omnitrophota bacterium]
MRAFWIIIGILLVAAVISYILIFWLNDIRLGTMHLRYSDYASAINYFHKALQKDANNPQTHLYLGLAYGKKGDYQKAFQEFAWLEKNYPDFSSSAQIHNEIGMLYYLNEMYKEAIREFRKATTLNPKFVDAYFNLGISYSSINDLKNAILAYRNALEVNPKHAYSHWNLAVVLEKVGDLRGAIKHWEKYLELTPKVFSNPEIERYIAELKKQIEKQ